ncbi:Os05g0313900, partial [Oryza sativa Japonica Group]
STETFLKPAFGPPFFYYENVALSSKGVWTTISRFLFDIQPEFVGSFCAAARKMDYIHNLPIENRSPVLPLPPNTISEAFLPTNMWWPSRSKKTVQLLAILRGKREAYRTLCSC